MSMRLHLEASLLRNSIVMAYTHCRKTSHLRDNNGQGDLPPATRLYCQDVAQAAVFLASENASWITETVLAVDNEVITN